METNDTDETSTSNDFSGERFDDLIDIYGQTPPREKVNRKLRIKGKNKKEKQRISSEAKLLSKNKSVKKMQACNRKIRADMLYMAPEVFMKNESGRAADIWSIGCCVIEMSSVGMGENPKIPDNISNDEVDFLHKCLQRNSKDRPTANQLLSHMFIRNLGDINIE